MNNDCGATADYAPAGDFGGKAINNFRYRTAFYALRRVLGRVEFGSIRMIIPGMAELVVPARHKSGPAAELRIHDPGAITRLFRGGDIGFAESYLDGQWDTPDLAALMTFAQLNEKALASAMMGSRLIRTLNRIFHKLRGNTRNGSRRNISYHYDLGNDFYANWLDESMTYSSALFEYPEQALRQAQLAKYRRIAELAELAPDANVLEIGCGWGGFMEHAARHYGCRVRGITLSREQLGYANRRMQTLGLDRRARASLTDYRDTSGQYDALISIEMLEAVGEANWPLYFDTLYQRLRPGSCAVVQVITIAEDRFPLYRRRTDFIQRHVFPGGMLPSRSLLREHASRSNLTLDYHETFGLSYARTLDSWRRRFLETWPETARQGFDNRFRRLWEYYLCYCETGFRTGATDVGIYRFRKPG